MLAPDRVQAFAAEFERLFRERTPAQSIHHVLCSSRVTFTEMASWYSRTYGEDLSPLARIDVQPALAKVMRRLRREFPGDRW